MHPLSLALGMTLSGFMPADTGGLQFQPGIARAEMPQEYLDVQAALARGETVDYNSLAASTIAALDILQRNINTGITAFPVRENLEAEAKVLIPTDTPLRNKIPRVPGAGTAAAWRQLTTFGGGWGTSLDQPGGGTAAQTFFAESGAPAEVTSTYAAKSASYKLMGQIGGVTDFAAAAGANFMDQRATERRNVLQNVMLAEENAIINADASSTAAPWGDGTTGYAFNGLINLITTANGTPTAQVQTTVGTLTFAHIDAQLRRLWTQGARGYWILLNQAQMQSIRDLASNASNGLYKIEAGSGGVFMIGMNVGGYIHPITGEVVPFIVSRFMPAGTMIFGCDQLPNGNPSLEMDVLPQVELPQLGTDPIQGYVVKDIANTITAPERRPFIVSVYEVLKMKSALHFAKSTGVS